MRKLLRAVATVAALSFVGVAVAGCQSTSEIVDDIQAAFGFKVSQAQVDAFRSTYVGFLKFGADYAETPRCLAGQSFFRNNCHDPATLRRIQGIKNSVSSGLVNMQAAIDTGDNQGALALFNTVKTALQTGQGIVVALTSPQ